MKLLSNYCRILFTFYSRENYNIFRYYLIKFIVFFKMFSNKVIRHFTPLLNLKSSIKFPSSKVFYSIRKASNQTPCVGIKNVYQHNYVPDSLHVTKIRTPTKSNYLTINNYSTNSKTEKMETKGCNESSKKLSTIDGLKELFSHPLTWHYNYGYLNILLGLIIFGFFFCRSCPAEKSSRKVTGV